MINKNEDFLQLGQHVRTYVCNPGRPTASNGLHLKCAELNLFFYINSTYTIVLEFSIYYSKKNKEVNYQFF